MAKAQLVLFPRPSEVSQAVVEELEDLLKEAREGNVQGIAYIALHRGVAMSDNVLGRLRLSPVLALGMLRVLQKSIEELLGSR